MAVVEFGIVKRAGVSYLYVRRRAFDFDDVAILDHAATRLEIDEAFGEFASNNRRGRRHVADTDIRSREFAQAACVDMQTTDGVVVLVAQDQHVITHRECVGREESTSPFACIEHRQGLRIDHCDAAEIGQRGDRADEIAQVVEVGRVGEGAAQHHAFACRLRALEQARVFIVEQGAERPGERIAVPLGKFAVRVAHNLNTRRGAARAVAWRIDLEIRFEFAEHEPEQERLFAAAAPLRPRPDGYGHALVPRGISSGNTDCWSSTRSSPDMIFLNSERLTET